MLLKPCFELLLDLVLLFQKRIYLLKVRSVALSFEKIFLVLIARFLRRIEFQEVSLTVALKLRLIWVFCSTQIWYWQSANKPSNISFGSGN
ncbi:hypothetical protein ACS87_13740 [Vibrio parahaemolyticus]|nr:hypothetical protein ACS87_13740 [Vibrio parahaemolyticus]